MKPHLLCTRFHTYNTMRLFPLDLLADTKKKKPNTLITLNLPLWLPTMAAEEDTPSLTAAAVVSQNASDSPPPPFPRLLGTRQPPYPQQ
ncbi:hypothetical protein HanLR1_Chr06g0206911 [Helianthus annuus]|nr:hypothetical protein HanLR1_Chr06g0206911 [Helianthus annuus]